MLERHRRMIFCCCDSFKDSASADAVNKSLQIACQRIFPKQKVETLNLSDGGEGFIDSLQSTLGATKYEAVVTGPLLTEIHTSFAIAHTNEKIGIFEMASASGLESVPTLKRNPLETTSKGTGDLIKLALEKNSDLKKIIIGIGGSATNDAGLGALQSLGLEIYNQNGLIEEPICGKHLNEIKSLNWKKDFSFPIEIDIACDVNNPFVGPFGAVNVFSEQKGAKTKAMKDELEKGMINVAKRIEEMTGVDISNIEGAGAAGGFGGSFKALLNANLIKGVDLVTNYLSLEKKIKESSLIITGEGCYDVQTEHGKIVSRVQDLCATHSKPVVIVCGKNATNQTPADGVFELLSLYTLDQSMNNTTESLMGLIDGNKNYLLDKMTKDL